jgi:hypothetical protein
VQHEIRIRHHDEDVKEANVQHESTANHEDEETKGENLKIKHLGLQEINKNKRDAKPTDAKLETVHYYSRMAS